MSSKLYSISLSEKFILSGLLFLILVVPLKAQNEFEPAILSGDTIEITSENQHSPGLASLYSAVLPGLGQAYNGKHWKIPIIYGSFFTFGFLIYDNDVKYQYFRKNLIAELDNNPETINVSGRDANGLRSNRDNFRRVRDLNMILLTVTYLLQIADAHIDAHLLEFNVNQDITVSLDPTLQENDSNLSPGFSLKLNLR